MKYLFTWFFSQLFLVLRIYVVQLVIVDKINNIQPVLIPFRKKRDLTLIRRFSKYFADF